MTERNAKFDHAENQKASDFQASYIMLAWGNDLVQLPVFICEFYTTRNVSDNIGSVALTKNVHCFVYRLILLFLSICWEFVDYYVT